MTTAFREEGLKRDSNHDELIKALNEGRRAAMRTINAVNRAIKELDEQHSKQLGSPSAESSAQSR
jgi:hypothetical protein